MIAKDTYIIRKLAKEDNKAIAAIIRSVLAEFKANKPGTVYYDPTTDDLFTLFQTPRSAYFVATVNNEIVGGSGVYPTPNLPEGCCELVKIYLSPVARGKGIGKALMQQCFNAAKELGYTSMYLETMPELSTAVGMYEQMGFTYLKGPLGNSGHFGCDIWMIKEL
ncbi:GNAT family N-acetyltransferase [Panacibacter ginsenosidivorans]|uniref:GNAT family N-acetyltransferase n=1 Tax=Panacibacter ginsenosidivorans TaxID=1813871 RepID=A0A5B8V6Q0_9BACT|nr:GNAT family N-acetyltransferase [Panacibacter ginsenosidivorans]QEC67094.1 GNAT family N-acetyltransferase [Panacibacter ginsenosidivorans]